RQIAWLHVAIEPYLRIWLHHAEKPLSADEEHRAIVAALRAGDPIAAEAVMEKHILDTAPALAAVVAEARAWREIQRCLNAGALSLHRHGHRRRISDLEVRGNRMKKIGKLASLAALTLSTLMLATAARADDKPTAITIATEGAYAPWNFTGSDGKAAGFEV